MRIAVTGATGNVGTAVVRALAADPKIDSIVGLARRLPDWRPPKTSWVAADVAYTDLRPHLEGADAVIHLAWLIQPSRDRSITEAVNVGGSRRVFEATVDAGVPSLIYASSVAAYSPASLDKPVDETWPTHGIEGSYYSQQKVAVERILDGIEARDPGVRIARARPGLIFQRAAASELRRLFGGPLVPGWLARRSLIPLVPQLKGVGGQVLHAADVAEAYRLLCHDSDASGAFNLATDPPLDLPALAHLLGARPVSLPTRPVRALVDVAWRARLQPVSADWLDLAAGLPVMKTDRARQELGWTPRHDSGDVVLEMMDGIRDGADFDTPPLAANTGGLLRLRELRSGVGGANALDRRSAAGAAAIRPVFSR